MLEQLDCFLIIKIDRLLCSSLVYKYSYAGCHANYVGSTSQAFYVREAEHNCQVILLVILLLIHRSLQFDFTLNSVPVLRMSIL